MSKTTTIISVLFCLVFSYTLFSAIKTSATLEPDFSIFYYASRDASHGSNPYIDHTLFTQFNYPLATTLLFIPITFLSYVTAQSVFTLLSLIAIGCIVYSSFILTKKKITISYFLLAAIFVLLPFPTKFTLGMGQTNLLAYGLLLLGFVFYKKKFLVSCILLILAVLLKPILATLFIIFLFEKEWRYFFVICIGIVVIIAITPFLFHQPQANLLFLHNLLHQSYAGREVYYNQGFLGFISRITSNLIYREMLNLFFTALLGVFLIGTFIKRKSNTVEKLFLLLTTLVILDPLSWQHHFVFLVLPFFAVIQSLQRVKNKYLTYSIFLLSYILVSWNIKTPANFSHFPASILLSHTFYGALLLFILEFMVFRGNKSKARK